MRMCMVHGAWMQVTAQTALTYKINTVRACGVWYREVTTIGY
jgi:hypothetical protein